tara:strand:+ start:4055 stop:4438 length:384 start_codon:yes stop_codon:yes gene_type:complete
MAETEVDEAIDENIEEEITEETTQDLPDGTNLSAEQDESESGKINSDVLQNIPVTISVEVGRTSLKIRDLMRLTQGSVVELDRIAGEPLDLLVNDTLVAQGEVVLVNERYGVRLTQVIPAAERVKNL